MPLTNMVGIQSLSKHTGLPKYRTENTRPEVRGCTPPAAHTLSHPVRLCDLVDWSPPGSSLSMGFSRQEYWSGLPCSPPGDLADPGIEPTSLMSPALAGRFFTI